MGLTVLGEKFFINAEELGEKKMFESLRTVNGDESPDPHSWRSQRKKSLVFCGSKYTMECMRPITHELPISHHCIAFSVSFFF